jgi:crotonobetainyl-CoA:carnitine CoA-transferase CaiB-like acyl-CoA transferase
VAEIFEDDHFKERDAIVTIDDEDFGSIALHGVFPKLSRTPRTIEHPGPELGEHTRSTLLSETSITEEEIEALRDEGVITFGE